MGRPRKSSGVSGRSLRRRTRRFSKVIGAEIEGFDDLVRKIRRLTLDTQGEVLRNATDAGAEIIGGGMERLAPRSRTGSRGNPPGYLASQIRTERIFTRTQDKATTHVGPTRRAFYGTILEITGHPWMRPAFDAHQPQATEEVGRAILRAVLNVARS